MFGILAYSIDLIGEIFTPKGAPTPILLISLWVPVYNCSFKGDSIGLCIFIMVLFILLFYIDFITSNCSFNPDVRNEDVIKNHV